MDITKDKVGTITVTGEFDISFSVKQELGSSESKQGTLRFKMTQVPLSDIIASSLKDKRINAQVSLRGDKFKELKDGQIVLLDYKGGRQPVDAEEAFRARLTAMTPEARAKKLAELEALAKSLK